MRPAGCGIDSPGIGTHSYSLISSEEHSAFEHSAAAIASHCSLAFTVHQVIIKKQTEEHKERLQKILMENNKEVHMQH